ncbi:unnamed protein product [Rotaria socialis]
MTTQQRRDQIQIIEFEGFAALEQLLLIQDEREQSQQIRDMQAFDEERQQEFNRIHNWDQRRLLDYQENRNTLVDEPNDDDQQQITSNRYWFTTTFMAGSILYDGKDKRFRFM